MNCAYDQKGGPPLTSNCFSNVNKRGVFCAWFHEFPMSNWEFVKTCHGYSQVSIKGLNTVKQATVYPNKIVPRCGLPQVDNRKSQPDYYDYLMCLRCGLPLLHHQLMLLRCGLPLLNYQLIHLRCRLPLSIYYTRNQTQRV